MSDKLLRSADGSVTGFQRAIPCVACDILPGQTIVETIGLVRGNSVRGIHLGRNILPIFRAVVGGRDSRLHEDAGRESRVSPRQDVGAGTRIGSKRGS